MAKAIVRIVYKAPEGMPPEQVAEAARDMAAAYTELFRTATDGLGDVEVVMIEGDQGPPPGYEIVAEYDIEDMTRPEWKTEAARSLLEILNEEGQNG